MNLCIDIGNTSIVFGVYNKSKIYKIFSLPTHPILKKDSYISFITTSFNDTLIDIKNIERIIYSSVVKELDNELTSALSSVFNKEILIVNNLLKLNFIIDIDNPSELGSDLISDICGAVNKYPTPLIIIDLGTINKVLFIDKSKHFQGALFFPGLGISSKTMNNNTSFLQNIKLDKPTSIIGKNSNDSINNGIVYSCVGGIKEIVNKIETTYKIRCKKILTGGLSIYVKNLLDKQYVYDKDLCLDGLNYLLKGN